MTRSQRGSYSIKDQPVTTYLAKRRAANPLDFLGVISTRLETGIVMKTPRGFILAAVLVASAWNLVLVAAAVFNAHWALTRVSGGQFQSLPIGLRIANLGFTVLTAWVMLFAWRLWKSGGARTAVDVRWAKLIVILYAASTLINIISKSSNERLNAIPAVIVAGGFILLRRPVG